MQSLSLWLRACKLAGTVEQTRGYNFSIKEKDNKIPACQISCTTLHSLTINNLSHDKVSIFQKLFRNGFEADHQKLVQKKAISAFINFIKRSSLLCLHGESLNLSFIFAMETPFSCRGILYKGRCSNIWCYSLLRLGHDPSRGLEPKVWLFGHFCDQKGSRSPKLF